jgi:hypothetical protein
MRPAPLSKYPLLNGLYASVRLVRRGCGDDPFSAGTGRPIPMLLCFSMTHIPCAYGVSLLTCLSLAFCEWSPSFAASAGAGLNAYVV